MEYKTLDEMVRIWRSIFSADKAKQKLSIGKYKLFTFTSGR